MNLKTIFYQLNIFAQARKHNLPLWQFPQFIFLLMGIIIIISMLFTYLIARELIVDPLVITLIVFFVTAILFILSYIITWNFEKLAEISRMKSEFIEIVSHQLKTPLVGLNWAIEFLASGDSSQTKTEREEYFKILKENSDRMTKLISDLLTTSKIEMKRLSFDKTEFFLEDLIKNLISRLDTQIKKENIEIKLQLQNNLPKIFTDSLQLKLVIENLLDNAFRYLQPNPTGSNNQKNSGGKIEISLEKSNNKIFFQIKDNGTGIPKEDQKYIFQKFFRAKNVLRYQTSGTGLGLYIAKNIIKRLGGKIGFHSEENKGSVFWFTLPIK